jgi:hypothetical protein
MKMQIQLAVAATFVAAASAPALAGYDIAQGSSAPQYTDHFLTFDEPGTPIGAVSTDYWATSHNIAELQAGDLAPQVDNWDATFGGTGGWLGENTNSFFGNFGVFMTLENAASEMSMQIWDPSGPPSFFGGGLNVILFNDGVQVHDLFLQNGDITEPAWGGIGDEWFNITTTGGDVFDEVRILGFGFTPTTFMDNLSYNEVVPAPGSLALLALAGIAGRRRRRA